MKEITDIVRENLISLRKANKLTQMELASQVNFSDKAISRWEKGEVVPDIPTLEKLAKLYNVPIQFFFEEHTNSNVSTQIKTNVLLIEILLFLSIWTLVLCLFAIFKYSHYDRPWTVIILGVPTSCIPLLVLNRKYFKKHWVFLSASSVLLWTIITYVFIILKNPDLWAVFLIGVPIQAILVAIFVLKKRTS